MFGGLFGGGKSKTSRTASQNKKLSSAIASSILQSVGAKASPPMPGAAQKAFQLATDPNAAARDFIEVIESDESLSARVIKIANSVFFDRGAASKTIEQSVNVIGINELRCLLNATTLSEIFPSKFPVRAHLWANDISTALISRMLAQRVMPAKAELAFLGGLMHDVGKLLLLQRMPEDFQGVLREIEQTGQESVLVEADKLGFTHTEVGQLIAEKWNFNTELSEIISRHHDDYARIGAISLVGVIKAADIISHALALGQSKNHHRVKQQAEEQLGATWDYLRIPASEAKEVLNRCQKTFDMEFDLYRSPGN